MEVSGWIPERESTRVRSMLGATDRGNPAPFGEAKPKGMRHPGASRRAKGSPPTYLHHQARQWSYSELTGITKPAKILQPYAYSVGPVLHATKFTHRCD